MKKIAIIVGWLCLFSFVSGLSFAGNRPGAVSLTLADAYYHFSSARQLDNASMPNVALAYNFNEHWAIESGIGVVNTNQHILNRVGEHGFLYTINGLYRFNPYKYVEPYAIAGIGVLGIQPQINNNSEHEGNINAGVGTQFFASESIAVRVELRDIYTLAGGKNDWLANFGISFLMDGK